MVSLSSVVLSEAVYPVITTAGIGIAYYQQSYCPMATGAMATGAMATGAMATGAMATGAMDTGAMA